MRAVDLSLVLLLVCGCGGKIVETAPLDDERATMQPSPLPPDKGKEKAPPPATQEPAAVTPAVQSSLDACNVLCERDARCDTTLPALPVQDGDRGGDCASRCQQRLAGKCGIDDWLLCYAAQITPNACTPLPDECRPAFCSWARCARQPVSNCE